MNRVVPFACLSVLTCSLAIGGSAGSDVPIAQCVYVPPAVADRVVFYDSFDHANRPEINRLGATVRGTLSVAADGFAGRACRSSPHAGGGQPVQLQSPALSLDRPITVMRWWRLDAAMTDTSSFELFSLAGRGHVSCFVRGRGEWCALKRPTMFVQVDSFHGIANVNQPVRDPAVFAPGEWHHVAVTVSNAAQVRVYLDGQPLASVDIKGRQFQPGDVDTLQAIATTAGPNDVPTASDELLVLDRALSPGEVADYVDASRNLRGLQYPVDARQ